MAAGLILLTGAFLAPLFKDLPQATLAAIVIVAVAGFFNVAELRRFAHVRRSAIAFALLALAATAEARVVVLDLVETTDIDIQTADALGELAAQLARTGAELRLAYVRAPALAILERAGITERVRVEPTLDAAVGQVEDTPPSTGSVTPVT